jgi:hypothetical protein
MNGNLNHVDTALVLVDIDKMRCHIINCLTAMHLVEAETKQKEAFVDNDDYELAKRKVFNAAISIISDDKFDSDEALVKSILLYFPISDERKVSDERSWLPQHFAIALGVRHKISEDDIRIMLSVDSLPPQRLNKIEADDESKGCKPNLEGPEGTILRDQSGRCALHLVAQYSESVELLQDILHIDHKMTKSVAQTDKGKIKSLGLLCRRFHFSTFDEMVLCLIEANSSVAVIYDGIVGCLGSYKERLRPEFAASFEDENTLTLIENLLNANPTVVKYKKSGIFRAACCNLRGEVGVSVLSLFLTEDSTGVKAVKDGCLPIYYAAGCSCLEVVKFLHKAYPESISMLGTEGRSLLHEAASDMIGDVADVTAKVKYICDQCPALIHLNGDTPLLDMLTNEGRFNFKCVEILCIVDATVVRDKCPSTNIHDFSGQLSLHIIIELFPSMSEVSDEADCFRLFLRLYPAAAGIEDDESNSPYDLAVGCGLSPYFKRLLLAADPTIDPIRRHNLNFAARRRGMFLAFSALSSNVEPTIWAKMRLKGRDLLEHVISYL